MLGGSFVSVIGTLGGAMNLFLSSRVHRHTLE